MRKKTPLSAYRAACKTKEGRAALVAQVVALCERHGLKYEVQEWESISPREVSVRFVVGQYACSVAFDGDMPVDEFTGDWHTQFVVGWRDLPGYPKHFDRVIGGSLNDTTYRKATSIADTADGLIDSLDRGIALLKLVLKKNDLALVQEDEPNLSHLANVA